MSTQLLHLSERSKINVLVDVSFNLPGTLLLEVKIGLVFGQIMACDSNHCLIEVGMFLKISIIDLEKAFLNIN